MVTTQRLTAPRNTFGGTKYVVTWIDETGEHALPFVQSWYGRVELRKHILQDEQCAIWMFNRRDRVYEESQLEYNKTLDAIKPKEKKQSNGAAYELLAQVSAMAQSLVKLYRKEDITEEYRQFRLLVDRLDEEMGLESYSEEATQ